MSTASPTPGTQVTPYKAIVAAVIAFLGALIVNTQGREDLDTWKDWLIIILTTAAAGGGTYATPYYKTTSTRRRGAAGYGALEALVAVVVVILIVWLLLNLFNGRA